MVNIPRDDTGAPIILAGSPGVAVYKGSNVTQKDSAEAYNTLDLDYDSVVGLCHVLIDLSGDAFFAPGEDYSVVLTTGTVNSIIKSSTVLAFFSIENRSQQATNDAILIDTAEIGTAGAGLDDLGGMSTAMAAEVNVECKDVLATDTFSELAQGAPSATPTIVSALQFIYKLARNKIEQTSTEPSVYDDAGAVVDQKSVVSDDGTTATRGEFITGA